MTTFSRLVIALTVFSLMLLPEFAVAQTDLAGQYECKGANANGSDAYTGVVTIEKDTNPGAYKFKWKISGDTYNGIGIQSGNVVSVAYKTKGSKDFGIALYSIQKDGSNLTGQWIFYPGGAPLGNETLTRK